MNAIDQSQHPCGDRICETCKECIFPREDLIPRRFKNKNKNMENLCNLCPALLKSYSQDSKTFDASCKLETFSTPSCIRPRRIEYNLTDRNDIVRPVWCPKRSVNGGNSETPQERLALPSSSQVSSVANSTTTLSYQERREKMKELKKHIEWSDIKEGNIYLIPKILYQSRKIVRVKTKTDYLCSCAEIDDDGVEKTWTCNVYPSDLDAVFITEIKNF